MTLPIRKLTLYKHGISVVERSGNVSGESVTLTFHRDLMNDVLKSLVALDRAGGKVRNIAYDAPEERDQKLARGSIHLGDGSTLQDLLRDLRGRSVEILVAYKEGARKVTGIVIGLDLDAEDGYKEARLSLLTKQGIEVLRLAEVQNVTLQDETAQNDLDFVLKASIAQPDQRSVVLRLSEGEHDVVVRYLAPSPTWRVSYRLVGDSNDKGERKALVQGWGIFDNPFDEALEDVQVALVAGMPISFIYDLYTPFTPQRPEIKEEARVVAAPIEMERASTRAMGKQMMAADMAMAPPAPAMMRAGGAGFTVAEMAEASPVAAEGEAKGDLFEYRIGHPVTVMRGEAAMVPILGTMLPYRKLHIYNGQKHPRNPAVVLRFKNESNLTLERGPITVIENDSYLGEAIFPFTRPGAEVLLAIAVDLGVSVTEHATNSRETHRISISQQYLVFEQFVRTSVRYEVQNSNPEAIYLLIEYPRERTAELEAGSGAPEETTESHYRFKVAVPAGPEGTTTFSVAQRRREVRHEQLNRLTDDALQEYMKHRWVDQALGGKLGDLLKLYDQKAQFQHRINEIDQERTRLNSVQEQARKNMSGLKETGEEGQLRSRYVRQLNQSEDQLATLEKERTRRTEESTQMDQRIAAFIAQLQPKG